MINDMKTEAEASNGVIALRQSYQNRQKFQEDLFINMVRFYQFQNSYHEESSLNEVIRNNKSLPEIQQAKKDLEKLRNKFAFKNLQNLCETTDLLQEMMDGVYPLLNQDWVFNKLLESKLAVVLIAGVSIRKNIDYSEILKIENKEGHDLIVSFLIEHAYFIWELNGFHVNDTVKVNVYEDVMDVRLLEYAENSIFK